jgi:N-acetylneuraminic acid mutarotase
MRRSICLILACIFILILSGISSKAKSKTLTGTLYYRDAPMSTLTEASPQFWFLNRDTFEYLYPDRDLTVNYDPTNSTYEILDCPESTKFLIDVSFPGEYGSDTNLPKSYDRQITIDTTTLDSQDIQIYYNIHLLTPFDNSNVNTYYPAPPYPAHNSPVQFSWEAVPGADSYEIEIQRTRDSDNPEGGYGDIETIINENTTSLTYIADIPPSALFEHYEFSLWAYENETYLGRYTTVYYGANGWNYRFKISKWVPESSMPTARDQFTGGVIGGKIYVFGGNGNPDGINLKSTEMFDPSTHLWTYKSSNENNGGQGVEELTGAVLNDKLYVFGAEGGGTPYGVFNFVQEYDPATDTWTSKSPKPTVVSGATAAVYDGEIFLFGGGYSNTETTTRIYYDVVEAYNPASNTWRIVTNMPYKLGHMAVSIIGKKAYLIGGYDRDTGNLQQNVIAYDFVSNQWITEGLGELSAPRLYFYASSAPIVDGKIYLVGGWTNVGWNFTDESNLSITNEVQIYNPSTQSFNIGPSLPQTIDDFLTLTTNNSIYVIGGQTDWENTISSNEVWRLDLAPKPNVIPMLMLLLD